MSHMTRSTYEPIGLRAVRPYLSVDDASAAIAFYVNAFEAKEVERNAKPDGGVGHAKLQIGETTLRSVSIRTRAGVRRRGGQVSRREPPANGRRTDWQGRVQRPSETAPGSFGGLRCSLTDSGRVAAPCPVGAKAT